MSALSSSLSFSFGLGSGEGELTLENYQTEFVGLGALALALYDTIQVGDLTLLATAGTVTDLGYTVNKEIPVAFLSVNDARRISVPSGVEYRILFAIDVNGANIGEVAEVARTDTEVVFSQNFYGLVAVAAHTRSVRILKYVPQRSGIVDMFGKVGITDTYGTVAAYKAGRLATCEVSPPTVANGADELEIYRVESKNLLNSEGEWEMPVGWPDSPTYPNGATPPRARIGVVSTRVHEVGMVTSEGYFYSRSFDVPTQKPYFGDTSYTPVKEVVQGSGLSKLPPALQIKAQEIINARGKGGYL